MPYYVIARTVDCMHGNMSLSSPATVVAREKPPQRGSDMELHYCQCDSKREAEKIARFKNAYNSWVFCPS